MTLVFKSFEQCSGWSNLDAFSLRYKLASQLTVHCHAIAGLMISLECNCDWTLAKVWLLYQLPAKQYWQTAIAKLSRHFASQG